MTFWFKPVPRSISRPLSFAVMVVWIGVMVVLVNRSYAQGSGNLATDLARYGSSAQWRGVYYRGEKLGFTVSQTVPFDGGDRRRRRRVRAAGGRAAADVAARRAYDHHAAHDRASQSGVRAAVIRVLARSRNRPDRDWRQSSAIWTCTISITSARPHAHAKCARLAERPMLSLNLVRRLADEGLDAGLASINGTSSIPRRCEMRRSTVKVGDREIVRSAEHADTRVPRRDGVHRA